MTRISRSRLDCDVAVVGGGVIGLASAWQLARRGAGRVLLLERASPGHTAGGSHGATRIFRSAYEDARYARLARLARRVDWPALESAVGGPLLHPHRACFFGPEDGPMAGYGEAIGASGAPIHPITLPSARRRFPELRFAEAGQLILDDHSAAVIAAEGTMTALAALCRAAGVEIRGQHQVRSLRAGPAGVRLEVTCVRAGADANHPGASDERAVEGEGGAGAGVEAAFELEVEAAAVVVAAGAASAALLGLPSAALRPVRQWVGYWRESAPSFPVWAYVDHAPDAFYYGLPALDGEGLKAARHVTRGAGLSMADEEAARMREVLGRLWSQSPSSSALLWHETCTYTMSPDDHFVIGAIPGSPRVYAATGGSGHAFKFAPLLGRCVAEMLLDGAAQDAETRELAAAWSPAREALRDAIS